MFEWLRLSKKRIDRYPVYLGDLAVVPRSDIRRFIEWDWEGEDTDIALKQWIAENLEIPLLQERQEEISDYLVIDVLLAQYRTGGSGSVEAGQLSFPLVWRPYIRLHFRLRMGATNKVLGNFFVKKKMGWGEYLDKAFSWRGVFGIGGVFKDEDMHHLLLAGLIEGLQWAQERAST